MLDTEATISAITTAVGPGAVGIVRLSGAQALAVAERMFRAASGRKLGSYPARTMVYGHVADEAGRNIDEVLCVFMQAPHSYTAEDVVEVQCHGGAESLREILALSWRLGARPAEPGEFTKRAFLNGRIDLVQAEAVMDIIQARSAAALQNALRQQEGHLSRTLRGIRKQLLDELVHVEAVIDYPEEDIEDVTYPQVERTLDVVKARVDALLARANTGRILREGLRTAIVGRPNVGKSSLLNILLREDRALVSAHAGTTRDVIEEQLLVDGVPLILMDTAGIHQATDEVEQMGIARSRKALEQAELLLVVLDGTSALAVEDREILDAAAGRSFVVLVNKQDLPQAGVLEQVRKNYPQATVIGISAKTGAGMEDLTRLVKQRVYGQQGEPDEGVYVQHERQAALLRQASQALEEARQGAAQRLPYDCLTIDMQTAITALGEVTGDAVQDEVLTQIFARFCVGK